MASKLQQQEKQIKEFELKALKERKGIFVEESQEEVSMQAANVMGTSQSISLKQLQEMRDLIKRLQGDSDNAKKDLAIQANQFKSQISKLRDDKAEAEKQLYETEFVLGEKDRDIERVREESKQQIKFLEDQVSDLKEKVTWFRQNQKLLSEDEEANKGNLKEINELQM